MVAITAAWGLGLPATGRQNAFEADVASGRACLGGINPPARYQPLQEPQKRSRVFSIKGHSSILAGGRKYHKPRSSKAKKDECPFVQNITLRNRFGWVW
jgi:hypothetical protein